MRRETLHSAFVTWVALAAAWLLGMGIAPSAEAAYMTTVQQVGSDVVATGSGSINLAGLIFSVNQSFEGYLDPSDGLLLLAGPSVNFTSYPLTYSGPTNFGSGSITFSSSGSGNVVGFDGPDTLAVPIGYVSNTPLGTSTATWDNATFASLGLSPGRYVWSLATGDIFTVQVGSIPEPPSLALFGASLAALWVRRRKGVAKSSRKKYLLPRCLVWTVASALVFQLAFFGSAESRFSVPA